jgi:isopenicillin-N epimerase
MADIDVSPRYGAALRPLWDLDPDFNTVNHGSFGATPLCVLAAQTRWRERIEAQPSRFMRRDLGPALREAAGALARFVGAEADDLAFVNNATAGCNAVLRSLDLAPGEEIVVLDHGYAAVRNAVAYVAERAGARVVSAALPFPASDDDAIVAAVGAALSSRTRLVLIDHVTSPSAVVLPVARLIAACQAAGAAVLVDGAHAPAMVDLDIAALGADYYTGNCHKWLMAPKGAGFLHVRSDRQAGLHPLAISHGYRQGFLAEFDWTGTTDFTAFLAVPDAIAFHEHLGGAALRARNCALAASAAARLAAHLGTQTAAPRTAPASMAVVRLPVDPTLALPEGLPRLTELRETVLTAGTDAPLHAMANAIWLRLSAAAYNEESDYDRLAAVLDDALRSFRLGV